MKKEKEYIKPHKSDVDDPKRESLATIIWYLIFIIAIPFSLRHFKGLDSLRFYFPLVDLIANICSSTGARTHYVFKNLYDVSPSNATSFISTNFINLIALLGVSWNGMHYAFKTGRAWIGIKVSLIMYMMTYLIPTQGIGWAVDRFQSWFGSTFYKYPTDKDNMDGKDYIKHNRFVDYGGGIIFVLLMLFLESVLIHLYLTIVDSHFV
jgi:hypothetical protein